MAGFCIFDDEAVREAANKEILRRYYTAAQDFAKLAGPENLVHKHKLIMQQAGVTSDINPAIAAALEREAQTDNPAGAMVLGDGTMVTGKTSDLLGACSALLLNALKKLAGIEDTIHLISTEVIEPICAMKTEVLGSRNPRLHSDEVLIALAASSVKNEYAKRALEVIPLLKDCDAHFSVILSAVDEKTFKKLGIKVTCEPKYEHRVLYHK